jgi:prolipoprotein diacylglyceryl transferase
MMALVLASIPSPPISEFHIGPVRVTFYGVLVMSGVIAAWLITKHRFVKQGGDPEIAEKLVIRMVVWGFVGARAAYVSTHLSRFEGEWWKVIAIWEGGIALFGGLTAGAIAMYVYGKRWGVRLPDFLDGVAVGLPVAQAIGRWGNYFNQELFGTPSDLPWAVEIDPAHRPDAYPDAETFHPTFLYESILNLLLAGFIYWVGRRYPSMRGRLIGVYFVGYGAIRFGLELIRTDTTFRFLGLSRNGWVSLGVVIIGIVVLRWRGLRPDSAEEESDASAVS